MSHNSWKMHRGMSGRRIMLCACPSKLIFAIAQDLHEYRVRVLDAPLYIQFGWMNAEC